MNAADSVSVYPALLGRVSLRGSALPPLPGEAQDSAVRLFASDDGAADLFWAGEAREVRTAAAGDGYRVLVGRLYALDARPLAGAAAIDAVLSNGSFTDRPAALDGAYVAVQVRSTRSRGVELRVQTDKYGFRTMYCCDSGGVLLFSTHLSGLRRLLHNKLPPVDRQALLHYYHFGVTPNRATLLRGIHKVPAATVLIVAAHRRAEERYFDPLELYRPEGQAVSGPLDQVSRGIDGAMSRAVRRRLTGDGGIALALSGGVDSGFIAKKLKQAGASIRAYHLAYGTAYDEFERVKRLEAHLGLDVVRLTLQPQQVWQTFERASATASEPIAFNDAALTALAGEARRDGALTLWDGDGADRIFLGMRGYLKYARAIRLYDAFRRMGLTRTAIAAIGAVPSPRTRKLATVWRNWSSAIPPYPERHYADTPSYDRQREERIFQLGISEFWAAFQRRADAADFGLFFSYVGIRMCPERFFHTPIEQQYGLGMRPVSPYWDDEVVGIGLSLPMSLKLKGRRTKYALRHAAALGGDAGYWMQSKIGLQSAARFWTASPEGAAWRREMRAALTSSAEFQSLRDMGEREPEPDRLLAYWVWKTRHEVRL